jgi:Flp pilus assembly protein TadB
MEPMIPPRMPRSFGGWLVMRTPTTLIGDRERDLAVGALAQHYAHGRLTRAEHEQRMTSALNARTNADLQGLFTDLPHPDAGLAPARRSRSRHLLRAVMSAVAALVVLIVVLQVLVVVAIAAAVVGAAVVVGRLAFEPRRRDPFIVQRPRGWRTNAGYRGW